MCEWVWIDGRTCPTVERWEKKNACIHWPVYRSFIDFNYHYRHIRHLSLSLSSSSCRSEREFGNVNLNSKWPLRPKSSMQGSNGRFYFSLVWSENACICKWEKPVTHSDCSQTAPSKQWNQHSSKWSMIFEWKKKIIKIVWVKEKKLVLTIGENAIKNQRI